MLNMGQTSEVVKRGTPDMPTARAWNADRARRELVERILRRLRLKDMTQSELADKIGSAKSSVSAALDLNGDGWFAGEKLVRLPAALDCSADWLFLGRGPEERIVLSEPQALLMGYRQALDDEQRDLERRREKLTRRQE